MKLYAGALEGVMELLREFSEKFQQVSVDEAYRMIEEFITGNQ